MNDRPSKLRGGKKSELTRFKELWRDTFSQEQRDYWRAQFESAQATQATIRAEIHTKHGISLMYDKQLTAFREWDFAQICRDEAAEEMREDEEAILAEHGEWTLDQVREEVIKRAYNRSIATGDFKLGLATMGLDLSKRDGETMARQQDEKIEISREKLKREDQKIEIAKQKLMDKVDMAVSAFSQEVKVLNNAELTALLDKFIAKIREVRQS